MTTTAQLKRRAENEKYLENRNVWAALQTISQSEGTNGNYQLAVYGTVKSSPVFPQLVGRKGTKENPVLLPHLRQYPRLLVAFNSKGEESSAVGKYQILRKTYAGAAATMGLTDFSEKTQDLLAVELMRQRGAIPFLLNGDIKTALDKIKHEWASIAGAGYGQGEHSIATLEKWFNDAVGYAGNHPAAAGGSVAGILICLFGLFF